MANTILFKVEVNTKTGVANIKNLEGELKTLGTTSKELGTTAKGVGDTLCKALVFVTQYI